MKTMINGLGYRSSFWRRCWLVVLCGLVSGVVSGQTDTPTATITNTPVGLPTFPPLTPGITPTIPAGSNGCPGFVVYYDDVDIQYAARCGRCLSEKPVPTKNVSYGLPNFGKLPVTPLFPTSTGTITPEATDELATWYPTVTPNGFVPTLTPTITNTPVASNTPAPTNTPPAGDMVFVHYQFSNEDELEFNIRGSNRVYSSPVSFMGTNSVLIPNAASDQRYYLSYEWRWFQETYVQDVLQDITYHITDKFTGTNGAAIHVYGFAANESQVFHYLVWEGEGNPVGAEFTIPAQVADTYDLNFTVDAVVQTVFIHVSIVTLDDNPFLSMSNFETNYESFGQFFPTSTPVATHTPTAFPPTNTPAPDATLTPRGFVDCAMPFGVVDRDDYFEFNPVSFIGENCPVHVFGVIDLTIINDAWLFPPIDFCIKWVALPSVKVFNIPIPFGALAALMAVGYILRRFSQF